MSDRKKSRKVAFAFAYAISTYGTSRQHFGGYVFRNGSDKPGLRLGSFVVVVVVILSSSVCIEFKKQSKLNDKNRFSAKARKIDDIFFEFLRTEFIQP